MPNIGQHRRYYLLDALRGITLVSMIAYHAVWDLTVVAGISWFRADSLMLSVWQKSICFTFILLSGFCWSLGHSHWKNGICVSAAGILITLITRIVIPEQQIWFGILSLLGASMLLLIPLEPLAKKINAGMGCAGSILLFAVTQSINQGTLLGPIPLPRVFYHGGALSNAMGFQTADFYSTDYFPLLPWFFLFLTGYFFYRLADQFDWLAHPLLCRRGKRLVTRLGQHSLLVYLLHQPILYGIIVLWTL